MFIRGLRNPPFVGPRQQWSVADGPEASARSDQPF
jgi:hypothetical protein